MKIRRIACAVRGYRLKLRLVDYGRLGCISYNTQYTIHANKFTKFCRNDAKIGKIRIRILEQKGDKKSLTLNIP